MLPLHQAYEVKAATLEYIRATFQFKEADVSRAFYSFIEDIQNGLFKGPYVSLKTPFVKAKSDEGIPLDIQPPFRPHYHQVESFKRLTTQDGHSPQPTLLTTGTGSGKTECFLYPVLDYVWQCNKEEIHKGVKVIILYPMNALASDQAKRLAETIWNDERLKGRVTAGLFIGEGSNPKDYPQEMGPENIIENRETIVQNPPDILLTNFKMLDYGLMQQRYMPLWKGNIDSAGPMLKFIVLDELHTYDGAQGTDVANLIRRLKLKLSIPEGHLVPVGTSATIGSGEESKGLLCEYATDVFGETFDKESVIEEHRLSVDEFIGEQDTVISELPSNEQLRTLSRENLTDRDAYLLSARKIWLPRCPEDPAEIGKRLRRLQIVKDILTVTCKGIADISCLKDELGKLNPRFKAKMSFKNPDYASIIIESVLALISIAKDKDDSGRLFPMLYLQIQLWQRELSGIQRLVQQEPEFTWRDAVPRDERLSLPIYFCRDCGTSGWLTMKRDTDQRFSADAAKINQAFMNGDKDIRLLNTDISSHEPDEEYRQGDYAVFEKCSIHPKDLSIAGRNETGTMRVIALSKGYRKKGGNVTKFDKHCPLCMGQDTIAIVGGRTTTLSSVAVSQIMSSDFDSTDISQRKMLTFSNSVQDAAHLAGFYEVRTFRFLLRQSIQNYLKSVGHAISLKDLQVGFKNYWKEHLEGDEYYYRFLPDQYIETIDLSKSYRDAGTGDFTDRFKNEFDLRVDWEICSEFGLMSQIGRTLEKMGSSATYFRREQLQKVFEKMKPWMNENNLDWISEREYLFLPFINGLLHRTRMRGGIDHEFLTLFRTSKLVPYMLNWNKPNDKVHFLNKYFSRNRLPRPIGYQYPKGNDEVLDVTSVRNRRRNWYYAYFVKSLLNPAQIVFSPNEEIINDFYHQLLEAFTECGLMNRKEANGLTNYALNPDAIMVESAIKSLKCERCESHLYIAKSDDVSEDTHCLDYKCDSGIYRVLEPEQHNYYRMVYDRESSPRIYANEHTGLLDRADRETLEHDFKEHPSPHSCNVLTATSTLEMGIDIGSLNVVANTGIPPKPSNFLQRVGRAGRKEGSALVINYAKGEKHDMYYFAEPLSMMEGDVSTPGCFLEARDILRRHFYAFCIDSWTSANANNIIPPKLINLQLTYDGINSADFFINKISGFIADHLDSLQTRFCAQYPAKTQSVLQEFFMTVTSGAFYQRIVDQFENLVNLLESIKKQRQELTKEYEQIPVNDEERRATVRNQVNALRSRDKAVRDENTVEFMTNVGLLPNYAFPETGVKLSATVYKTRAKGDTTNNTTEPQTIELIRPASQGIRELAPGNIFYTQKLGMEIKGLSLNDQPDSIQKLRFCSVCDAIASEADESYNSLVCPKCGHPSWRNNLHHFLKFTTATTGVYQTDAALDDKHDDRDRKRYTTMKHFRFIADGPVVSYGLKNVAFGIEFCKSVELVEVNYGDKDQLVAPIEINSTQHISSLGFVTCRHCGKAAPVYTNSKTAAEMHFPYCRFKDVEFPGDENNRDLWLQLYLHRSMNTEAIKVLLPVQYFDTESSIAMFKAGLELGMRHYYASNPDHIRIDSYREFNRSTGEFDNYLVIYDTIPGGSGYLHKLTDTKEFTKLLEKSYEKIRDCKCQLEGKDGCYHCILTYGNQWQRTGLSRERAEELFRNIFNEAKNNRWETINGSIGSITSSGVIEESELEVLFIRAMEHLAKELHWKWVKVYDSSNGSYQYDLTIEDDDREIKYIVHPQYRLGPAQGVSQMTRPDFQFICTYAKIDGEEIDISTIPQFSIYTDGYAFHASEENMNFYKDFMRREAIRKSTGVPRYSWTLTWKDIEPFTKSESNQEQIDDFEHHSPVPELLDDFPNKLYRASGNLDRFLFILENPVPEMFGKEIFSYLASCWTDENQYISSYSQVNKAVMENAKNQYNDISAEDEDTCHFFVKTKFIRRNGIMNGSAWYAYDTESSWWKGIKYCIELRSELQGAERSAWEDFWRRYNLIQFFSAVEQSVPISDFVPIDTDLFPGLENIIEQLNANHIQVETDEECALKNDDGIIIAEAAIQIKGHKIVIDDFSERENESDAFRSAGYTVILKENFNINDLKEKLII